TLYALHLYYIITYVQLVSQIVRMEHPMMGSFTRCQLCFLDLTKSDGIIATLPTPSHILLCGHIVCDRCKNENKDESSHILCRFCGFQYDSFHMPSKNETNSSPFFLEKCQIYCGDHLKPFDLQCSCGDTICTLCAQDSHAAHFRYVELFETTDKLNEELARMRQARNQMSEDKTAVLKEKYRIENAIITANAEIATKFARIIAQAISRC
ncbi:hypothetical protein PFISCL1PPCAC_21546, partial [Pristionchus fissidentatus]